MEKLKLKLLYAKYGVARLNKDENVPHWATCKNFLSITKTDDELSIVSEEENFPVSVKCERNWRILKVLGPLDFSLIGILSSISTTLAKQKVSIFAISTYDTDYILVKEASLDVAIKALEEANFIIIK